MPNVAVGAVGTPDKFGLARSALRARPVDTNAVVASLVVLSPGDCVTPVAPVGRDGAPVNVGLLISAFRASPAATNAVVAMAVVLLPGD